MGKKSPTIMESVEEFLLGSPKTAGGLKKAPTPAKKPIKKAHAKKVKKAKKVAKKAPAKKKKARKAG
jgi:hypothetical protein